MKMGGRVGAALAFA